jgi:HK97 family phage portal protein
MQYQKTVYENEVLHLTLNHRDLRPVINGITASYMRLVQAAMSAYGWQNGQHWKVHVNQMASGKDDWLSTFQQMLENQIKPFINSGSAILPEFDGYDYQNVGQTEKKSDSTDLRALIAETFDMTARAFGIPAVLINGQIEGTQDANARFLTNCIDPLADQLAEEINRKRYGYDGWARGSYVVVDTSSILHFDMFANAANVEKLVGSGAFSINDVLKAAGHAPINEPWADQHFITKNFENMADAVALAGS